MKCISIFKCNPQIEVIDKSHCSLEDVPNFQVYSRSLEELFLDANKLTVLNENVFRLTKLRRFSFSDNAIQDIPPDIAKLVNLVELDCSRNKIQVIPEQIKFLRGLQICDFSANNIEYLPTGLVQLKNLTCLTLNYCPIKNLPEDFGLLKNLESLELRENELESLPASITALESLKKLDIGRNLINKLPEDIGRLSKLEYLLVDGNRLETVPTKIGRLENLQCLDLGQQECGLKYLPEEISGLTSLTDLHLSENHLLTLPDGIKYLKNLTIFKADNNYLSELNANIGGCTSLQELVLTSNQISKLPSSIGSLTDLRSLNVDSNLLKELTPQIGNLKNLGILSLRDNLLTHLPNEIEQLDMVKVMDFSGNRLEYLPINITALSLKALWLSKNQAQPLPKLQIDELANSPGTRVLTCYLLPQQSEESNDVNEEHIMNNAMQDNHETNQRHAAVSFDTAAIDDAELDDDAQFVRHDTPHPRELKARHQKLFINTPLTGGKTELKGHDNASFTMVDNQQPVDHSLSDRRNYAHEQSASTIAYKPATYQHIEYESNGLPEIPLPYEQQHSNLRQSYNGTSHLAPRIDSHTFRDVPSNYSTQDSTTDNYVQENRRKQENGVSRGGKTPQTDKAQSYLKNNNNSYEVEDTHTRINSNSRDQNCHILDILVRRSKNHKPGLGLSIAGGKDTPPYKDSDEGIFVSKVTQGGPAEAAGVRVGDKILAVNSNTFYEGITHQKAVDIFKKVKPDCVEFTMRILRDPNDVMKDQEERIDNDDYSFNPATDSIVTSSSKLMDKSNTSTFTRTYTIPVSSETTNGTVNNIRQYLLKEPEKEVRKSTTTSSTLPPGMSLLDGSLNKNIIYTTLVKDYQHDLGLVLENRTDGNESRSNWSNIVISKIQPDSIASIDGKLQVDDRLLSINGADVTGIDLDRIMLMLAGVDRFIRIVVSRGDADDPIGAALRNMPVRPPLGSWFSSTSNMSHRPSLIESYQRPTFGSVSSLQKTQPKLTGTKPPKPPKPTHLTPSRENSDSSPTPTEQIEDMRNPVARPRVRDIVASSTSSQSHIIELEKRAAWRRERLKSIDDDVEMAKLIAEAQRRRREEK